jgi:hypothetical protein
LEAPPSSGETPGESGAFLLCPVAVRAAAAFSTFALYLETLELTS